MSDDPAPTALRWSGHTDRGKIRQNNEDSFLALQFDAREVRYLGKIGEDSFDKGDYVFAVSDGMGGAKSGEFASKIAVEKITRLLPKSYNLGAMGIAAGFGDILNELFQAIHAEIMKLGSYYEECKGMGATLTLVWLTPKWLFFGHVGDSRLYYLPPGGPLKQLSEDHSHVGHLRRTGKINEREARTHPRKSMLSMSLGAGNQFLTPHVGAVGLQPRDRFLLCSDGIIDGLWDRGIEEFLSASQPSPQSTYAADLVREAVSESGRDNTTAVVVEVR